MEKIEGMSEIFRQSKQVFLTTTSKNGEIKTRPMTNYNDSPYKEMWFPSFKNTRKVKDIEFNPKVIISFPADEENKWYKLEGGAKLASWEEVKKMWRWWFLEWVPEEDRKLLRYDDPFLDRSIIWIKPEKAYIDNKK
jgi:general stress protein 26